MSLVRPAREWKVKRTGDPGTVQLEFSIAGLNFIDVPTLTNYVLLIDQDGNGDFTNGTVAQINPTSKTGSVLRFDGLTLPEGAVFTFAYSASASWTLTATSPTANYNAVGNTIAYSISVANTGNLSISGVTLASQVITSGPTLTSGDNGNNVLDIGETWMFTASRAVTQSDLDNGNVNAQFTAAGTPLAGTLTNATGNAVVNAVQSPSWTLSKTSTTANYNNAGDVLSYVLVLTNTGNVSINAVSLTDDKATTGPTLASGDIGSDNILGVGEAWMYNATYTVVQADVDGGSVTNTATASGTPAGGTLANATDNVTVNALQSPGWSMVKESSLTLFSHVGDMIPYTIKVTNTGNETITGVTVADPQATTGPTFVSGDTDSDNELDVSETWTYTATYQVVQADIDAGSFTNTATASATFPIGLANATASKTIPAIQSPAWTLSSSVSATYQSVGETLFYNLSLTNTGNEPISNITLTDPLATTGPTYVSGDTGSDQVLGLGEIWVYSSTHVVTQADLDAGAVSSTTTASGTPNAGVLANATAPATSSAIQNPSWTATLASPTPTYVQPGDPIAYTLSISNTGNVSINSVAAALTQVTTGPTF